MSLPAARNREWTNKNLCIFFVVCSWFVAGPSWAAEDWYWKGRGQLLEKNYSSSTQLENLTGVAVFVEGDYLERGGFALGYNSNLTNYRSGLSSGLFEVAEDILFLSARANFHPDLLPGRLTLRLDGYAGTDKLRYRISTPTPGMGGGSTKKTVTVNDDLSVVNPMASFLNYSKTFYVDLGYAYSSYRSDDTGTDDIDIAQWTPTVGLGFNRAFDWLQLRGYFISVSKSNRVTDINDTSALEAKWTHWFSAEAPLGLHSVRMTVLTGERIYAVDSDACSLCNLPDLQTGMLAVGAEWKLSEKTGVLLQGGYETYKNVVLDDPYSSMYLYGHVSRTW